jgi:hypothetical protein
MGCLKLPIHIKAVDPQPVQLGLQRIAVGDRLRGVITCADTSVALDLRVFFTTGATSVTDDTTGRTAGLAGIARASVTQGSATSGRAATSQRRTGSVE